MKKVSKKRNGGSTFILADLFFYALIPYVLWKFGRDVFGDYIAMLITTIPGFIYTVYRFYKDRQFNMVGVFLLSSLLLGTVVDLLSGSAERMLWNGVYLGLFYTGIFVVSFIIRRPLALYFAVDFAYLQGYPRKESKHYIFKKEFSNGFN